jgi:hypothetical protein
MPAQSGPHTGGSRLADPGRREFGHSPFLPLLLVVVGAVAWSAFQCYQLANERQGLAIVHTNQTRQYEDAGKLRTTLDSLARETAALADKGNPGAKLIISELAKRGVTINPNAPPASPGTPATPDKGTK